MTRSLYAGASALALLAAAPALASNNQSNVVQQGTQATATVTQNAGSNNSSDIMQKSGGQVTVTQSGPKGSTSKVVTEADPNLGPATPNTVNVTQSDVGNTGTLAGQANYSEVIQDNVNLGTTATINQSHTGGAAGQNFSYVRQGRNASNGDVRVTQTGGNNSSLYTSSTSSDNGATITQDGTFNASNVQQDFQIKALASVEQIGEGGGLNSATIQQISTGFAPPPPDEFALGADAEIFQNGSNNSSYISQTGFATVMAKANEATNHQIGSDNVSTVLQGGIDNTATALQYGDDNRSWIEQGGNGNIATVTQDGNDNQSTILQPGTGNTALVSQLSNNNISFVSQGGSGNTATVSQ